MIFQLILKSQQKRREKLDAQIKPFNPDILLNQRVEKLCVSNSDSNASTSEVSIKSKCIIIATGNGSFGPNKPPILNIGEFENKSVFTQSKISRNSE